MMFASHDVPQPDGWNLEIVIVLACLTVIYLSIRTIVRFDRAERDRRADEWLSRSYTRPRPR